jgi:hypothetical protein
VTRSGFPAGYPVEDAGTDPCQHMQRDMGGGHAAQECGTVADGPDPANAAVSDGTVKLICDRPLLRYSAP